MVEGVENVRKQGGGEKNFSMSTLEVSHLGSGEYEAFHSKIDGNQWQINRVREHQILPC